MKKNILVEAILRQRTEKGKYPIVDIPDNGISNWGDGARTMAFVYSKEYGNFILRGFRKEVMDFLKENFSHYFVYISMWSDGKSRGHWKFWKDRNVTIFEPSDLFKCRKYRIVKYDDTHRKREKEMYFKRLPKRWIPEFDEL